MSDIKKSQHKCYVDNAVEGDNECVLDYGDASGCDEALGLLAQGLCKTDCSYWRHVEAAADSNGRAARQVKVKSLIRMEALVARQAATVNEFRLATDLAATAPEFKGSFGHGAFYKPL